MLQPVRGHLRFVVLNECVDQRVFPDAIAIRFGNAWQAYIHNGVTLLQGEPVTFPFEDLTECDGGRS